MQAPCSYRVLCQENAIFWDTAGVNQASRGAGLYPAFYDTLKRTADIARLRDGTPAPCHVLDSLPDDWLLQQDRFGSVIRVRPSIISGFMRNGRFIHADRRCGSALNRVRHSEPGGTARIASEEAQDQVRWLGRDNAQNT